MLEITTQDCTILFRSGHADSQRPDDRSIQKVLYKHAAVKYREKRGDKNDTAPSDTIMAEELGYLLRAMHSWCSDHRIDCSLLSEARITEFYNSVIKRDSGTFKDQDDVFIDSFVVNLEDFLFYLYDSKVALSTRLNSATYMLSKFPICGLGVSLALSYNIALYYQAADLASWLTQLRATIVYQIAEKYVKDNRIVPANAAHVHDQINKFAQSEGWNIGMEQMTMPKEIFPALRNLIRPKNYDHIRETFLHRYREEAILYVTETFLSWLCDTFRRAAENSDELRFDSDGYNIFFRQINQKLQELALPGALHVFIEVQEECIRLKNISRPHVMALIAYGMKALGYIESDFKRTSLPHAELHAMQRPYGNMVHIGLSPLTIIRIKKLGSPNNSNDELLCDDADKHYVEVRDEEYELSEFVAYLFADKEPGSPSDKDIEEILRNISAVDYASVRALIKEIYTYSPKNITRRDALLRLCFIMIHDDVWETQELVDIPEKIIHFVTLDDIIRSLPQRDQYYSQCCVRVLQDISCHPNSEEVIQVHKDNQHLKRAIFEAALTACKKSDINLVMTACYHIPNIFSFHDKHGYTLLLRAIESSSEVLLNALLKFQPNFTSLPPDDAKEMYGFSVLELAAHRGSLPIFKLLCEHGAKPTSNEKLFMKQHLIHVAVKANATDIVRYILENPEQFRGCLNAVDEYMQTPLMWAASEGHINVLKILINKGANVQKKARWTTSDPRDGYSALFWAAYGDHVECFEYFLKECSVDVNVINNSVTRHTVAHVAARCGSVNVMQYIMKHHPDVLLQTIDACTQTPLILAIQNKQVRMVSKLLECGISPDDANDLNGVTPLLWAIRCGSLDMVKLLINHNATTVISNGAINTNALYYAIQYKQQEIVDYLTQNNLCNMTLHDSDEFMSFDALSQEHLDDHLLEQRTPSCIIATFNTLLIRQHQDSRRIWQYIMDNEHRFEDCTDTDNVTMSALVSLAREIKKSDSKALHFITEVLFYNMAFPFDCMDRVIQEELSQCSKHSLPSLVKCISTLILIYHTAGIEDYNYYMLFSKILEKLALEYDQYKFTMKIYQDAIDPITGDGVLHVAIKRRWSTQALSFLLRHLPITAMLSMNEQGMCPFELLCHAAVTDDSGLRSLKNIHSLVTILEESINVRHKDGKKRLFDVFMNLLLLESSVSSGNTVFAIAVEIYQDETESLIDLILFNDGPPHIRNPALFDTMIKVVGVRHVVGRILCRDDCNIDVIHATLHVVCSLYRGLAHADDKSMLRLSILNAYNYLHHKDKIFIFIETNIRALLEHAGDDVMTFLEPFVSEPAHVHPDVLKIYSKVIDTLACLVGADKVSAAIQASQYTEPLPNKTVLSNNDDASDGTMVSVCIFNCVDINEDIRALRLSLQDQFPRLMFMFRVTALDNQHHLCIPEDCDDFEDVCQFLSSTIDPLNGQGAHVIYDMVVKQAVITKLLQIMSLLKQKIQASKTELFLSKENTQLLEVMETMITMLRKLPNITPRSTFDAIIQDSISQANAKNNPNHPPTMLITTILSNVEATTDTLLSQPNIEQATLADLCDLIVEPCPSICANDPALLLTQDTSFGKTKNSNTLLTFH